MEFGHNGMEFRHGGTEFAHNGTEVADFETRDGRFEMAITDNGMDPVRNGTLTAISGCELRSRILQR